MAAGEPLGAECLSQLVSSGFVLLEAELEGSAARCCWNFSPQPGGKSAASAAGEFSSSDRKDNAENGRNGTEISM
ncbi:heat shock factor-binding protein 1-like protein 1 isoform X1 [Gallus gallus]|uniref:heat shock factor-binding protein 1-like protein 1 isoform X1 n=1 Tax=Gallus gallus TaxID=9031 RepID=UPI001AE2F580|nr:heat shock factor-binding protein 1-like protein 1 isoform X1 [Gallus gallus]XP_046767332.1 heat shock factor-binding protein 1-like protein 1 isoform X1 [Gallus gallus]